LLLIELAIKEGQFEDAALRMKELKPNVLRKYKTQINNLNQQIKQATKKAVK